MDSKLDHDLIASIWDLIVDYFENDKEKAWGWFIAPNKAFDGKSPGYLIYVEGRADEVENALVDWFY